MIATLAGSTRRVKHPFVNSPSSADIDIDFTGWADVAAMLADTAVFWTSEAVNTSMISFATDVSYEGRARSMKYNMNGLGSAAISPGQFKLPENTTQAWFEWVIRFSANYTLDGPEPGGAEYKLTASGDIDSGVGRWNLPEMQAGQFVMGYPGNEAGFTSSAITPSTLWDNAPHLFRAQLKVSPSGSAGILRMTCNGTTLVNQTGFDTAVSHDEINAFAPGLNMNKGCNTPGMFTAWHVFRAWHVQSPSWGGIFT